MTYQVFDTTLRDGAQREGITYSVVDKLAVARLLDELGVGFIEGGWPGAMPKDTEFFRRARTELDLKHALLVAFGATRRADLRPTPTRRCGRCSTRRPRRSAWSRSPTCATSSARCVPPARRTSPWSGTPWSSCGPRAGGSSSTASTSSTASGSIPGTPPRWRRPRSRPGAEVAVMCDTNGGMLPSMVTRAVIDVADRLAALLGYRRGCVRRLGIHCQNDTSCAVANTIAAVEAGVRHFQCTANGYGERPGNADLFATVANLQLKLGLPVLPEGCLEQMVRVSHAIAEIANLAPDTHQAYVGAAAFAHKAGLHASAIKVDPVLYNHIDPAIVGNDMKILVTEMAGRASSSSSHASSGWTWPAIRRRCPG